MAPPRDKHKPIAVTITTVTEIGRPAAPSGGSRRVSARATIVYCAIAVFLAGYGGSILFVALPGIATEFGANVTSLATLGSILSLGSAIGLPLAVVADRGRRGPVAAVGIAGFSLAGLVTAIVPSIGVLAIARLAAVCCETVVAAVATAATLEAVGSSRRGQAASLLALCGGAGATVSLVAYPVVAPHWRILYGCAGLGVLVAPLALRISSHRPAGAQVSARVLLDSPWRRRLLVLAASGALGALLYEPANFFAIFFGSRSLGLQPFAGGLDRDQLHLLARALCRRQHSVVGLRQRQRADAGRLDHGADADQGQGHRIHRDRGGGGAWRRWWAAAGSSPGAGSRPRWNPLAHRGRRRGRQLGPACPSRNPGRRSARIEPAGLRMRSVQAGAASLIPTVISSACRVAREG